MQTKMADTLSSALCKNDFQNINETNAFPVVAHETLS